jgi:serine O-acetyltransferase
VTRFVEVIASDLMANTGRSGLIPTLSALAFHPGFNAVFFHRIASRLKRGGFGRLALLMWRFNTAFSSCHLHLDSIIGAGLSLPHPTGVVIGQGVTIGPRCTIYQNCTVGRGSTANGYPEIGQGSTIYPNSVVFGAIQIGENCVIGAGAVVNKSIRAGAVAVGNPARLLVPQAHQSESA